MRKVNFKQSFSFNNQYADDKFALDFIISFYAGDLTCIGSPCTRNDVMQLNTVSVIHGYVISEVSNDLLNNLFYTFVNYWKSNDGT